MNPLRERQLHSGRQLINRLVCKQHLRSPLPGHIFPARILCFDQRDLLRPAPALQLLLATDRLMNVVEAFKVHQPVAMVFAAEAFRLAGLMLKHAAVDAVRHANVKRSRAAAHDVNEIRVFSHRRRPIVHTLTMSS
jgi:hypothetical protein